MTDPPTTPHVTHLDVDEAWIADWAAEGVAALERYLSRHAAFAAYLRAHGLLHSGNGDRDPDA
jgi:hypothetical protein